jgi:hypothetical protein
MSDQPGSLEWIVKEIGLLLRPLGYVLTPEEIRNLLFVDLGADLSAGALDLPGFRGALGQVATMASQLPATISDLTAALDEDQIVVAVQEAGHLGEQIRTTIAALDHIVEELQKLSHSLPGLTEEQIGRFARGLPARLLELLAIKYLGDYIVKKELLLLLGIIEQQPIPVDPNNPDQGFFLREELHPRRFLNLLKSPTGHARAVYGWGDASFKGQLFLDRLRDFLSVSGIPAEVIPARASTPAALEILFFSLRQSAGATPPGLDLELKVPIATGFALTYPLSPAFTLEFSSDGQFDPGLRVLVRPPADIALLPPGGTLQGRLQADIVGKNADRAQPFVILGQTGGSRLEATSIELNFGLSASLPSGAPSPRGDLLVGADIKGGRLLLDLSTADGFLASFLPGDSIEAELELGATWTPAEGLRFRGSAGLEIVLPVNRSLGPVKFQGLYISARLDTDAGRIPVEISGAFSGGLGPLTVTVDRLGFEAQISFPEGVGNLGPIDFGIGFKPPNGLGLAIDASVVGGGGFLRFDPQKEEYSGVLELQIEETIAVKAIGLLITRLPDGGKGYSLLIIITAEDFQPIPLGLGFNLTGIGGLLAVNRTFDEDALRAGLRNHTLDSVLFPRDPIRNAAQILSNVNRVFPPASGHYLFGPMAQITWGTPTLITANLALVLELGARLRLLILAQLRAVLPTPDDELMRLQMDAVGVIDFDQGTAALDATLHDSRLLRKFALTGDMAMRLRWDSSPSFALGVGGLHPAFSPPPGFPKLDRIAINLAAGDSPRLRCEAYFALTANTVQFGARAELYASASGFSIQGETGFDVLIQLSPFSFLADFYAQLQLKRGSTNLFKVRVEGALAGPRPLHIKAKATFEILWWDVTIRVDTTLVEGEKPPLPAPVDVFPLLRDALSSPGNWLSQLPPRQRQVVTLRAVTPGTSAPVQTLLHPLGTLAIKQTVVPLDLDISRFGAATPTGARRFSITSVSLGGQNQAAQPLRDFFAPAQFIEMSDGEKLSRPSFESMTGGVAIGSSEVAISANAADWLEVPAIEFETLIVDKATGGTRPSPPPEQQGRYRLTPILLGQQARFGAAGSSELRRTGKERYRSTADKYLVAREGWTIVTTDDLAVQTASVSYSEAVQALTRIKQQQPTRADVLKILRKSELSIA